MSTANAEHLRKQAKKLVRLYPRVVKEHPKSLSLSTAQSLIAQLNGFPTWESLVNRQSVAHKGSQAKQPSTAIRLSDHLFLSVDDLKQLLPTTYSVETGSPTRYRMGYEAIMRYKHVSEVALARSEDDKLDKIFGQVFSGFIDMSYLNLDRPTRLGLLGASRKSLKKYPYCIETVARISGLLHAEGDYAHAMEILEPYAKQLLDMIPADRYVQVPYGFLDNRPFHRLMHSYVLLLHKSGRHDDARRIAEKMVNLHPNDNIGFRFLVENGKDN